MSTVFDVASYILKVVGGEVTAMKLQKLCYYSQAWSLVWDELPLFDEDIQAWANGPVIPELYAAHKGQFLVKMIDQGNPDHLTPQQKETVNKIVEYYGKFDPQQLSDMTHLEDPWRLARAGIPDGDRCEKIISLDSMAEYYSSI